MTTVHTFHHHALPDGPVFSSFSSSIAEAMLVNFLSIVLDKIANTVKIKVSSNALPWGILMVALITSLVLFSMGEVEQGSIVIGLAFVLVFFMYMWRN